MLGLGSTRVQDEQAIVRLHDALLPGGTLVLDNEEKPFRGHVRDWNVPGEGPIALSSRVDAVDEDDHCVHMTIRAEADDGRVEVLPGIDENTLVYVASRDGDLQPLPRRD